MEWSGVYVCMYMMTVNKVEGCKVTLNTSLFELGSLLIVCNSPWSTGRRLVWPVHPPVRCPACQCEP